MRNEYDPLTLPPFHRSTPARMTSAWAGTRAASPLAMPGVAWRAATFTSRPRLSSGSKVEDGKQEEIGREKNKEAGRLWIEHLLMEYSKIFSISYKGSAIFGQKENF